jgi:hypothetical protein
MRNLLALTVISLVLLNGCQGITWNGIENETYCDCSGNICNMNGGQMIQASLEEAGFTVYPHAIGNNVITEATRSFGNVTQVINVRFDSLPMVRTAFTLPESNNTITRAEVQEMKNISAEDLWVWEGKPAFRLEESSERALIVIKRFDPASEVNASVISSAADEITAYVEIFRQETGLPLKQTDYDGDLYLPVDKSEYR